MFPMILASPQTHLTLPIDAYYGLRATIDPLRSWHSFASQHRHAYGRWMMQAALEKAAERRLSEEASTTWQIDGDKAQLNFRLPNIESGSLSARLSDDRRSIFLSGKTCTDTKLAEITLPYGHESKPDDIEILERSDGTFMIRASVPEKPALDLKIVSSSPPPDEEITSAQVPREASREMDEEKMLDSKFNIAIDEGAKHVAVAEETKPVEKDASAQAGEDELSNGH